MIAGLQGNGPSQMISNLNKTLAFVTSQSGATTPSKLEPASSSGLGQTNTYQRNNVPQFDNASIVHEAFLSSAS